MYWDSFKEYLYHNPRLNLMLDFSRAGFSREYLQQMAPAMQQALDRMAQLEQGALANPDEGRMVGHYWLRNPDLAPNPEIAGAIRTTVSRIKNFAEDIHSGRLRSPAGLPFRQLILIGIGGSSLGPQFVAAALRTGAERLALHFLDNTDPEGFDLVLSQVGRQLAETLVVVVSKSGGTIETRNGMLEVQKAFRDKGLSPAGHFVAVTQEGSALDKIALQEGWLGRFPMWDWVGGRTSETSAVGLLPAALQGFDIGSLLQGAAQCDEATRNLQLLENPAALLALAWYKASGGQGGTELVILPYKDRLALLTRYLQQLIMESLGKERDLDGRLVRQGLTVLGNKGSTDQHSYVQQLLDGPLNTLVTFVEVLRDRQGPATYVEEDVTSGDYLAAFLYGTRQALTEKGRGSITITVPEVNAYTIGALIALFERTVGLYAYLVNINAYHQPAVERGKKGAKKAIELQRAALAFLRSRPGQGFSAWEIACCIGREEETELIFKIMEHAAHNPDHGVKRQAAVPIYETKYFI